MGGGVRAGQLTSHQGGWITSKPNSTWKAACRQQSRASLMRSEPEALFSKWVDAFWANFIYPNGVRAIVNCLVKLWSQRNPELRRAGNKRLHNTKQAHTLLCYRRQVMAAPALQETFITQCRQHNQPEPPRAREDTGSIWSGLPQPDSMFSCHQQEERVFLLGVKRSDLDFRMQLSNIAASFSLLCLDSSLFSHMYPLKAEEVCK